MKPPTAQSLEPEELHAVEVHLDKLLADRGMTLTELAERANVSVVNLSVLKNGRARAVRFSTLTVRGWDCSRCRASLRDCTSLVCGPHQRV